MWVLRWQVQSHSNPARHYTVAVDEHGTFGCDCPQGKYHRDRGPCKHIREVQAGSARATKLPSQDPARTVTMPPAVAPAAAEAGGARLRNVKEVYAAMKAAAGKVPDREATASNAPATNLLAALDE